MRARWGKNTNSYELGLYFTNWGYPIGYKWELGINFFKWQIGIELYK